MDHSDRLALDAHIVGDYQDGDTVGRNTELLEYIAANMLTIDRVMEEIEKRLPELLSGLDKSPTIALISRFIK